MQTHAVRTYLSLLLALLLCFSLPVAAKTIEESFDVGENGKLTLRTDSGKLIVKTHSRDTLLLDIEIEGEKADDFDVTFDKSGDDVSVTGKLKNRTGWGWNNTIRATFIITVPEHYNLDMHTSGGSIDIADLIGNVDVDTSGGSIEVGNITGRVKLQTSGGSISTEAIRGPLDANTSGGSIRVTLAEQITEDAELRTSGGSITAYLIEDIAINIDASTSGGRVRSDFDVDGRVNKKSIRGEINGGGPTLELHTSGGSVSIKSL